MTALATLKPVLLSLLAELAGIPCVWEDRANPHMSTDDRAELRLSGFAESIGRDDVTVHHVVGPVVTAVALTDLLTLPGHGLAAGAGVRFTVDAGGTFPGGLEADRLYYVLPGLTLTANTFTVSATEGGAVVDLLDAGSGTMRLLLAGKDLENKVRGPRRLPLTVKAYSLEQTDELSADEYLERVVTRLSWPSSEATLSSVSCGVVSRGRVRLLQAALDGRVPSVAALELELAFMDEAVDTAHRYARITSLGVEGTFAGRVSDKVNIDETIGA